jgi:hypothetical protein
MRLSRAQTSIRADSPSGKAPTTLVRLRISRMILSIPLLVRILIQCCLGNFIYVSVSSILTIQHTESIHHTNGMIGSWTDWDLSEHGIEQAKRIGERLSPEIMNKQYVMYSSDLLRARHTAEIIAAFLNIEPILTDRLRERNLGETVGKSVEWARQNTIVWEKTIDDKPLQNCCTTLP